MNSHLTLKRYEKIVLSGLVAIVLFVAGAFGYVHYVGSKYIVDTLDELPVSPYAIVLGASVTAGNPTPVLSDRIDTAAALFNEHKVDKIIVSGDDTKRGYREAVPMKNALVHDGVPAEDIIIDPDGIDTYTTMYRAYKVYGVKEAIVVTQNFHLSRAVFLARSIGIEAYGVRADKREYSVWNSFREVFANVKAILDLTLLKYRGTIAG